MMRTQFCSIRLFKAMCVDMHLMQMPALAAFPDHLHHPMANGALLASVFIDTFLAEATFLCMTDQAMFQGLVTMMP